jgi:hypothetical protein
MLTKSNSTAPGSVLPFGNDSAMLECGSRTKLSILHMPVFWQGFVFLQCVVALNQYANRHLC